MPTTYCSSLSHGLNAGKVRKHDPVIDAYRTSRDRLIQAIEETGSEVIGRRCHCPHPDHEDRNPSASIYYRDGVWRVKCHTCGQGGDVFDVMAMASGTTPGEAMQAVRNDNPLPITPQPRRSEPVRPSVNWQAVYDRGRDELHPGELFDFADAELGLSGEGVEALQPTILDDCYAFPERDAKANVIGLVKRMPDGKKLAATGSRRGLTYRVPFPDVDPVVVVEGQTDTAAAIEAGCNAVGRPSNRGGGELLAELLKDRTVIVYGENDQKDNGAWPGRDGAEAIAEQLRPVCKSVRIEYPPKGCKDVREMVAKGGAA